jgi:hypothetical protein
MGAGTEAGTGAGLPVAMAGYGVTVSRGLFTLCRLSTLSTLHGWRWGTSRPAILAGHFYRKAWVVPTLERHGWIAVEPLCRP